MDRHDFMRACSAGGPRIAEALRELQRDYGRALLHEAMAALGELQAARDLLQDTLIKAWQRCAQYRGESELFPWLKSVLRHGAADQLRRRRPEEPLADEQGQVFAEVEAALQRHAAQPTAPDQLMSIAELERVYRACQARFQRDHPAAANVVRWIAEDDLEPAEIAVLLQRSPGATREYLSQCRKKARLYFHEWYLLASGSAPPREADSPRKAADESV
ncbi:sigma-70 family RNA polymerase sigma factor [Aquincola sp. S2]|uniref:Sigma-70 family RNA polymerase sigma factor n=1 Tax=Pseudaquabacterium terrae TaxID=2732868 RepID=A0ABX2EUG4_9BURK|nr:sigma-70 family RNA polymerase sigma factor [Aquabacterium terrae]NRF72101.1 sigma-70 family RNA polymerase sigma factor [Aquabacterium terrae]